jgi:hypothetical protein
MPTSSVKQCCPFSKECTHTAHNDGSSPNRVRPHIVKDAQCQRDASQRWNQQCEELEEVEPNGNARCDPKATKECGENALQAELELVVTDDWGHIRACHG